MENLPSHRQLLTSLISSLSSLPPPTSPTSAAASTTSPLQSISSSQRHLLLTLHVLFPNLLLPALDLLDRGLVTCLTLKDRTAGGESASATQAPTSAQAPDGDGQDVVDDPSGVATKTSLLSRANKVTDDNPTGFFLVKSLASTLTRRKRDVAQASQRYVVHLGTWNCSCANFTFEAFPGNAEPTSSNPTQPTLQQQPRDEQTAWSFGGLSLDGIGSAVAHVPCCKHLLACLLVDRWPGMLNRYSQNRHVTEEEMAGIVADM
ncbi:hypothetical protein G7046_g5537 [Stylonectria norvegica]|nr:hypothetical protein G7046_g5537 [Stylonectria norvegica]